MVGVEMLFDRVEMFPGNGHIKGKARGSSAVWDDENLNRRSIAIIEKDDEEEENNAN